MILQAVGHGNRRETWKCRSNGQISTEAVHSEADNLRYQLVGRRVRWGGRAVEAGALDLLVVVTVCR